jgi:asparagine synthase (glutamine-hydrolysing)
MCGIAGIVRFDGGAVDQDVLRRLAGALTHRGPDGEGIYAAGPVGFVHRRLAIIDPAGGAQPLIDREGGLSLTYNGEVYNFVEIRRELGDAGFTTASDTEVVLRAWRRWGVAALDRFRGMFAFALHDAKAGKVFLVRDRLGIKPLYYRSSQNGLTFASELGAFLSAGEPVGPVDPDALSLYLRYGYVPTPKTIYVEVEKLEPGHYLEIDLARARVSKHRYWRLEPRYARRLEAECLEELEALLREIVGLYVRSDVPFGAFLSGGVDSSTVTALMSEVLRDPVRSFSIGFAESEYSELAYAQEAATRLGTRHHAAVLDPTVSLPWLLSLAARFGEPFADSSCIPTWYVSHLAAAEVKMVLSGDGGDELFAGYASYPAVLEQTGAGRRQPLAAMRRYFEERGILSGRPAKQRAHWSDTHHQQRDTFSATEREALTGRMPTPVADEKIASPADIDYVTRCQLRDIGAYLLDDILVKVDRMSMDNSLEVRVPLLDHKLVEFAFSLPLELRLHRSGEGVVGKYLLKKAAERFFPRRFLDRPKWGFGIPIHAWLGGALRPLVGDLLESGANGLAALVDPSAVRGIVGAYYAGDQQRVGQVWCLLALRLWADAIRAQPKSAELAAG